MGGFSFPNAKKVWFVIFMLCQQYALSKKNQLDEYSSPSAIFGKKATPFNCNVNNNTQRRFIPPYQPEDKPKICLGFFLIRRSHTEANALCIKEGFDGLVEIPNDKFDRSIKSELQRQGSQVPFGNKEAKSIDMYSFWIGARFDVDDESWSWMTSGTPIHQNQPPPRRNSYVNWLSGVKGYKNQPDDQMMDRCVDVQLRNFLVPGNANGRTEEVYAWYDTNCEFKQPFICSKTMV